MLTRGEDYAYGQPSLTRKKMRRLQITAGARRYPGKTGIWATNKTMAQAERALALQAERPTRTPSATGRRQAGEGGRECDTGARIK